MHTITIHRGAKIFKCGEVINVKNEYAVKQYFVKCNLPNGDAILESFQMASKDTAIHCISKRPKNYRSTFNSKHGRAW